MTTGGPSSRPPGAPGPAAPPAPAEDTLPPSQPSWRAAPSRDPDDQIALASTVLQPAADGAPPPSALTLVPGAGAETAAPPASLADRFSDFHFLGEGGMGAVYRATDRRLQREVAIKLLHGGPETTSRLLREARSQSRVEHENVCHVHEVGVADGQRFIVMQYVPGEPLDRAAQRMTLGEKVRVIRTVADALHEAHRLGLVHRDVKPSNVLVEQTDSNEYKPYLMDFGIAREAGEAGQTMTGAIAGTPAFMAPEQARGEVRSLDRRTDVYGLGATLHAVLTGNPPFAGGSLAGLLHRVIHEDPPRLRKVSPRLPVDLEAIVQKCLEKEPQRRYDSARELGEDLQRYLDGEPVQARRADVFYLLRKKLRRHARKVALAAVVLAAAAVVVTAWVRDRQRAAEQAILAQELGENVKEMELFLRNAYGMPLHDVERERDVVRARLALIEERMAAVGPVGEGPGRYALGRGALALGDPETARAHFERALAAGYSSPELELALGRALGEQLLRALEEARRITGEDQRKKRLAELDVTLRAPALSHLRAAVAARLESPAYAEGLIALHTGDLQGAIQKAAEAFEKAPWMYEAKKLEGDALYAMGSTYRHDAAFDYERMKQYFDPAAKAYAEASDAARSDPDVHRAECELWEKMGWAASARRLSIAGPFDAARAACDRAVRASSRDGNARLQRALVLSARLHALQTAGTPPPAAEIDEAVRAAEDARRARPDDAMSHYAVGRVRMYQARGLDPSERRTCIEAAIAAYVEATRLDPKFTWAFNELGQAHVAAAEAKLLTGDGVRDDVASAVRQFDEATRLDPAFSLAAQEKVRALSVALEADLAAGTSSDASADALVSAADALAERAGVDAWMVTYWRAKSRVLRAQHELSLDRDPGASAAAVREVVNAVGEEAVTDVWLQAQVASSLRVEVAYALRHGRPARASLGEMRAVLARMSPGALRDVAATIELAAIRESAPGEVNEASFDAALAALAPELSAEGDDPSYPLLAAEILAARAAWLARSGEDPEPAVAAGLSRAGAALAVNPHMAAALAAKGSLLLARARAARDPAARKAAAAQAKEAFDAALRENPRLARDHGDALRDLAAELP